MLSKRGQKSADSLDIPWRFAPGGGKNRYDAVTNPTGVIKVGSAENTLVKEKLHKFITKKVHLSVDTLGYGSEAKYGCLLANAISVHMNEYFAPHTPVHPDQILTASSLTPIHSLVGHSLGDPGDGILVSRPIYGRFELDFGNVAGQKIIYADTDPVSSFETGVVHEYEKAVSKAAKDGVRIAALLIVNPHNPLGRCYPRETLVEIMRFCGKHQIHLISDEIYARSVFDEENEDLPNFTSVLSIDPEGLINTELLHVFWGFSKDFGAAGLRLGSIITRNVQLRKAITANFRFHPPSGPSLAIGTAILEDRQFVREFAKFNHEQVKDAFRFVTKTLDEAGIRYQKANAGFFVYIDLGPWLRSPKSDDISGNEPEYELAQKVLDNGLGLHPCEEHNSARGHFRFVYTSNERPVLEEGLRRLIAVLKSIKE